LTYYYENQDKVNEQIKRGLEESEELATHRSDAEFRRKLGNLKRSVLSVALYMDVHVRRAVTYALRLRSIDVLMAQEDGAAELDDDRLLQRATELGRVLFSRRRISSAREHGG
jgi:hypothetical protein